MNPARDLRDAKGGLGSGGVYFPKSRPNTDALVSHQERLSEAPNVENGPRGKEKATHIMMLTQAISAGKTCKLVMTPIKYHTTPLTCFFSLSRIRNPSTFS